MNRTDFSHLHSIQPAVTIPLLQAVTSGVVVTVAGGAVVWWFGWKPAVMFLAGTGVLCVTWFVLLRQWVQEKRHLLGIPAVYIEDEPETGSDLIPNIRLEIREENTVQFLNLPVNQEQLCHLAVGVLEGRSLSETVWCGSGKPFTKSQFHELRDVLLARGLLSWRNQEFPSQGLELTTPGRHVFKRFAVMEQNYLPADTEPNW